ncbi:MAG: vitamin B12-dependent ribonucleotide reductase [Myxococcales bacterium]|nr:vitamin B12-dependent ribonucleotide reductase [Myxococcales bacterium]
MIDKVEARKVSQASQGHGKSSSPKRRRSDTSGRRAHAHGMTVPRYFTQAGVDPYDLLEWEFRTAAISSEAGHTVFEQKDVEVPKAWSQLATNVVVQKYFRGAVGTPARERSVKQLMSRVVDTISGWGAAQNYFATDADAAAFADELKHLLVEQKLSFNSPVWFNVGVEKHPQCSACFINSVEDTMESILTLAKTEGMLFKYGSGTGTNLSPLRSSREKLQGGGDASGPVSFMKGFDAFAGVIKSGGKTRRAAKMVILNVDHPDIVEYIGCKMAEEKKAHALIDAGYEGTFTGEAYGSVFFQNSNNSVRVTDQFMEAVQHDRAWHTRAVTNGAPVDTHRAKDIWRQIGEAAWHCGDPGLQFDTTINAWHTASNTARINASNPCSEYMFLDDSACNLASLNLRKFQNALGELDIAALKKATEISILAQEIVVDNARYPTDRIRDNSVAYRPLGLGYANLGALLMSRGLPYDSDAGRAYAGAVTALMCGHAYATSAKIARDVTGACSGYEANRAPFLGVMEKHRKSVDKIDAALVPYDLMQAAREVWDDTLTVGREHGFRNAQVTVLAPTGTIGFMMDCDTTGIEPDIALIKYKRLVGGGMLKIVNHTVGEALEKLGYHAADVQSILDYVDKHETIEGAPALKPEHLAVFDCAFRPAQGTRSIHYMGHIKMMSAAQPFLSGAISKTVNLPSEATVEDIQSAYLEAWKLGLKAIAVYRDGCKRSQPVSTAKVEDTTGLSGKGAQAAQPTLSPEELLRQVAMTLKPTGAPVAMRRKLEAERDSKTHKFAVAGHDGYITVGMYEDGTPGEIFIRMAKEGSTVSGLMDCFATAVSLALQHGVPLRLLVDKFAHTRFDPAGYTGNEEIPRASSIMDYLFRWLSAKFLPDHDAVDPSQLPLTLAPEPTKLQVAAAQHAGPNGSAHGGANGKTVAHATVQATAQATAKMSWQQETDAPLCHECGSMMVRSGACHKCLNCGSTSGCS